MLEVANLILVVGGDATAHDVRQKFRCQKFKAKAQHLSDRVERRTRYRRSVFC